MDITIKKAELCQITDYQTFKETLGAELRASAEGFVRIGYLLKQARDTDILYESGYKNLTEFAQAEYGLTKDIVSRYIAINDKYSENGYSDQLREEFRGFGVAKLAEMLTLPESVVEEMRPELTKSEIRELKEAVKEEEKVTDIEVAIEAAEVEEKTPEVAELSLLERALIEVFRSEPEHYCRIREYIENDLPDIERRFVEELAPAGYMIYTVRIAGIGTVMIKLDDTLMSITNVRSGEKQAFSYQSILSTESGFICGDVMDDHKEAWEHLTGDKYPKQKEAEKEKVAPAQPKKEHVKTIKPEKKEKKKGMEEDPYWKNLKEEVKEDRGEEKDEEVQKDEVEEHPESKEDAGAEHDQTDQTEQSDKSEAGDNKGSDESISESSGADNETGSECGGNSEQDIQAGERGPSESVGQTEETISIDKMLEDVDKMAEKPSMPVSVARQRLKGWIEDIVRSAGELQRFFEYENYDMAIKVSTEVEREIFEIEKLLRVMRKKIDENMDGSDE